MIANEDDYYDSIKKNQFDGNGKSPRSSPEVVSHRFAAYGRRSVVSSIHETVHICWSLFAQKSRQVRLLRENKFEKVYKFGAAYPVQNLSIKFYSLICNYVIVQNLTYMPGGGGVVAMERKLIPGGSAPRSDPLPSFIT